MHELSVTEALLDLTVQHAATAQAARVTDVYVVIGQLSAVIDESVQFILLIFYKNNVFFGK